MTRGDTPHVVHYSTLNHSRATLYVVQADGLISTVEAAEVLGLDRSAVTRAAASGRLPVALAAPGRNGAKFFRRDDVDALAAERAGT